MSSSTVFFGVQPSEGQAVAPSLSAKGISLLKIEPSKVIVQGGPTTIQPGFAVYRSFLPAFIRAALQGGVLRTNDAYSPIPFKLITKDIPLNYPDLVVSWKVPVGEEVRAQMRAAGFNDTVVRGKPAMIVRYPTANHIRVALDHSCVTTSPAPENAVNVRDLRKCGLIKNIIKAFIAVHQYPAFTDEEHEGEFKKGITSVPLEAKEAIEGDDDGEDNEDVDMENVVMAPDFVPERFKISLPVDAKDVDLYTDEHGAPKTPGLIFPFTPELAKFDRYTVIDVIKKYFFAGLGRTVEECTGEFEDLVSAWGNIHNSTFGNIVSHIFKVIDIALTTQTCVHIIMTANNYDGCFMRGAGYSIKILGREYKAASAEEITRELPKIDSHANAFWAILQDLDMLEDARLEAFRTYRSIWKLKSLLDSLSIKGGTGVRDRILRNAKNLSFPDDRYLEPTAVGIVKALSFIADENKDITSLGALYPPFLFVTSRVELVMGCFGSLAPSFRVPGGKEMYLNRPFRITNAKLKAEKGPEGHKDIVRIAAQLVVVEEAVKHMKQCIELKTVLNPFGNAVVSRSASHISKEFEGESCSMILTALREVAKATVVDVGRGKRGREGDEDDVGGPSKKGRLEYDL